MTRLLILNPALKKWTWIDSSRGWRSKAFQKSFVINLKVNCKSMQGFTCLHDYLLLYLVENYIDGAEFCYLSEKDVRDIIKPIGIVKKILRLIPKVKGYGVVDIFSVHSIDVYD